MRDSRGLKALMRAVSLAARPYHTATPLAAMAMPKLVSTDDPAFAYPPRQAYTPPPPLPAPRKLLVDALLVDAAGTLLIPSEPAAEVYLRYARRHGLPCSKPAEVLARYREAYNTPWGASPLRYVGDGRPFWRHIVAHALGASHEAAFEDIYEYYARGEAWTVSPGAVDALRRIRSRLGLKLAVVSNFDTRLRRILADLGLGDVFDAVTVSAEVGAEKPNPRLFEAACDALGVAPGAAVHVGDDRRNDLFGARDAGCYAWLWGADVHNFAEVERRLETGNFYDDLEPHPEAGDDTL